MMASKLLKSLFGDPDQPENEYYDDNQATPVDNNKVVPMTAARAKASQITLYEPRLYADVKQIASQLLNSRAVIVNFSQMDSKVAARIVDFLNGTVFAIDGDIKRIGKEIFLCTPKNFEVSGDLSTEVSATLKQDSDNL